MNSPEILRWRADVRVIQFAAVFVVVTGGCSKTQPKVVPRAADSSLPVIHLLALDEKGKLDAPGELQALAKKAKDTGVTDIFILAHGWNNSSDEARASYEERFRRAHEASLVNPSLRPTPFNAMVIGLIWPSKAWDYGPVPEGAAASVSLTAEQKAALAESLPSSAAASAAERDNDLKAVVQLAQKKKADTTLEDRKKAFAIFRKYSIKPTEVKYRTPDDESRFDGALPETASPLPEGVFSSIADAARVFTFWQMKKRAGIVGQNGGAEILKALASASPSCRVHLFGHSFGCKLLLSALLALSKADSAIKVDTVVLVQGAISYQAMADRVTGMTPPTPGGYRDVLTTVRGPIVATFSTHDFPLNDAYPLGSLLAGQTGELEVITRYSALGAVGFDKVNAVEMKAPGQAYGLTNDTRLYSVSGSEYIAGHGEISDPAVAWLEWAAVVRN